MQKLVYYFIEIKGELRQITIVPEQSEIVVRAMQRLDGKLPRNTPFTVEMVKREIKRWSYKNGEFWLSDRSIRQVILQCDDRPVRYTTI